MSITEIAAIGGLLIALVAASITAWSVVVAARKQAQAALDAARHQALVNADLSVYQIRATLSSASKQQWIETLRTELAELCSEMVMLQVIASKKLHQHEAEAVDQTKRMTNRTARICLLLDADQPTHLTLLDALAVQWQSIVLSETSIGEAVADLMGAGQQVLKHEMEQLQRLTAFTARGETSASGSPATKPGSAQ